MSFSSGKLVVSYLLENWEKDLKFAQLFIITLLGKFHLYQISFQLKIKTLEETISYLLHQVSLK